MSGPGFPDAAIGQIFESAEKGSVLALPPIAAAVGGSYSLLFRTDRRRGLVEEGSCCGVEETYVARLKDAAREQLLPSWLHGLRPGSVRDRAAFGTDQEFGRTAFYNHVIRPEGRFHCLIATPLVSDGVGFHLIVGRPRAHEEFNTGDQRVLGALLPHVGEILRLQAQLAAAQAFAHHALDVLGRRDSPVMVAGVDGTLLFANAAARRGFAAGLGLRVDHLARTLVCEGAGNTGRLRRALRAAASSGAETITLPLDEGEAIEVTIRRCAVEADPAKRSEAASPRLILHVEGAAIPEGERRVARVARDHGLTRRETQLLEAMVEGATLQQAAGRLGMTYNTGRTHLRQIFGKVDLHRQGDLLRFCATGRRPGA